MWSSRMSGRNYPTGIPENVDRRKLAALSRLIDSRSAAPLVLTVALWLTATAGLRPLMLPDEGRYVGIAWDMLTSGDWLVPRLDGLPFFHKPPLFYWLSAVGMGLGGAHELPARAPSLLAATLAATALFLFVRRYRDSRVATLAVVILCTQPGFYAGAQFANLDMLVAGMISLTILSGADSLLRREQELPWRAALARTYVFAAVGVLAKGLIGIVLPVGVLASWLLWRRSWRFLSMLFWLPGWLLFLLIALPWFFWMQHSFAGFFDYFVVYHHFQRFSQTGFNNQMPIWFYLPVILLGGLPWSPWFARVGWKSFRDSVEPSGLRSLMAIWLLLIVLFFSLPSSKLVGYILPAIPPFAYLLADSFSAWFDRDWRQAERWYARTLALAAIACLVLVVAVAVTDRASARHLASTTKGVFAAHEQLIMVDEYQYDLPFYLRAQQASWVVSAWDDPEIPRQDNWRKELADGGRFDPAAEQAVLLTPTRLVARLCGSDAGVVWIWGRRRASAVLPWLSEQVVFGADQKHSLWRIEPTALKTLCSEMPRSD